MERIEHFALLTDLELEDFSLRFEKIFNLTRMNFDYENETEWVEIEHEGVNYNVSRPYEAGVLNGWDSSIPEPCNFGISFGILRKGKVSDDEINKFGNLLAVEFQTPVYYHRTWIRVGKNEIRNRRFGPEL